MSDPLVSFSIIRETKSLLDSLGDLQLTVQLHMNPHQKIGMQILGGFFTYMYSVCVAASELTAEKTALSQTLTF